MTSTDTNTTLIVSTAQELTLQLVHHVPFGLSAVLLQSWTPTEYRLRNLHIASVALCQITSWQYAQYRPGTSRGCCVDFSYPRPPRLQLKPEARP